MCSPVVDLFRCPESLLCRPIEWNDSEDLAAKCGAALPAEMVNNLRLEKYPNAVAGKVKLGNPSKARAFYYALRPYFPVSVRKWMQRIYLSGWKNIDFPKWPVDFTADLICERSLALAMQEQGLAAVPFIWFWPRGTDACVVITHDVENERGRDATSALMDLNDRYGVKSSFQLIPEQRYQVSQEFIDGIRQRGFEINVHDLTHDGALFRNRAEFAQRTRKINEYGKQWKAHGFRAGALYRRQEWFDALEFAYDMSVPTVGSLDPQPGGCCTLFPYFIGALLEIPVTLIQDYTLFHILGDYSIDIWRKQINIIRRRHGLIHVIVHPDYIVTRRCWRVYEAFLQLLREMRDSQRLSFMLPGDVNSWWRARNATQLVGSGSDWRMVGPAAEEASIAYARAEGDRLIFEPPAVAAVA